MSKTNIELLSDFTKVAADIQDGRATFKVDDEWKAIRIVRALVEKKALPKTASGFTEKYDPLAAGLIDTRNMTTEQARAAASQGYFPAGHVINFEREFSSLGDTRNMSSAEYAAAVERQKMSSRIVVNKNADVFYDGKNLSINEAKIDFAVLKP